MSRSVNRPAVLCCHRGALAGAGHMDAGLVRFRTRSFVSSPGWHDFRAVLAGLRESCPPALPVIVRASWLPKTILGQCFRREKRFVVLLSDQMRQAQAVEVLCHEWAHALAWNFSLDRLAMKPDLNDDDFQAASHDEAWGCAYSRVWRAYLDLF